MTLSSQRAAKCRGLSEGELRSLRCPLLNCPETVCIGSCCSARTADVLRNTGHPAAAKNRIFSPPVHSNTVLLLWGRERWPAGTAGIICPSASAIRGHSQGRRQAVPPPHTAKTPAGVCWTDWKSCRSSCNPQKAGQRLPASCSRNVRCTT